MLNFGLIGCGRIAKKHASLLGSGSVEGARLAAVCDVDPQRAAEFAKRHGVPSYQSYQQMLAEAPLDVVSILTPSGMHAQHAIDAARMGKHVVVEKPMALTIRDADEMIRVCDECGVKLFVVKQNRYNAPVVELKKALDAGRFGKLVSGSVRVRWARDQAYYDQDDWRGTWKMDGGVFANQASHHVDLLMWMLGEPVSVFAKARTALVDIEAEDTGLAIVQFQNGALGCIEATTATRPRDLEGSLSILGEKGTVVIGGFAVNRIDTWQFANPEPDDERIVREANQNPPDVYGFGHLTYLDQIVTCIRTGRRALVDGFEGRRSLELVSAIYESIETSREVKLRFTPQRCRLGLGA